MEWLRVVVEWVKGVLRLVGNDVKDFIKYVEEKRVLSQIVEVLVFLGLEVVELVELALAPQEKVRFVIS